MIKRKTFKVTLVGDERTIIETTYNNLVSGREYATMCKHTEVQLDTFKENLDSLINHIENLEKQKSKILELQKMVNKAYHVRYNTLDAGTSETESSD